MHADASYWDFASSKGVVVALVGLGNTTRIGQLHTDIAINRRDLQS